MKTHRILTWNFSYPIREKKELMTNKNVDLSLKSLFFRIKSKV